MALDTRLERLLMQAVQAGGEQAAIEPGLAETLVNQVSRATVQQESQGLPAVLLVPPALRWLLARFLRRSIPQLKVLSHAEIPDSRNIRVTNLIGGQT